MSHYFDHAATTPIRQVAIDAWVEYAGLLNPSAQYGAGRKANAVLSEARETIAELLGADPVEVIFTGSGTEADNIAVRGLFDASSLDRIVATPIEHPAVHETVNALASHGAQVDYLPVAETGHVDLGDRAQEMLTQPAAVVACMWANNETGAIQPVAEVIGATPSPVHVDAVQVVGHLPVHFHDLGATTLAASAHKFGGPKGVGLLLARRSPSPAPVLHGGGQERGIRPGTVDAAAAAATAAALKEAIGEMDRESVRLTALRNRLIAEISARIASAHVTTCEPALPGHVHVTFAGANGDSMIMLLDSMGVDASTGSACNSGVNQASYVLGAMGTPHAEGALRFTLGRTTTDGDTDQLISVLPEVIKRSTF